jgi:microsomal dipeptidase-like Zn-dependent dipeptidase
MNFLTGLLSIAILFYSSITVFASEESKTWSASDKAKKFVQETIVIGFFATPYGAGWTEDKHLHDYLNRSRAAGITGHSMTLAAASHTWENFLSEHSKWRSTMAQDPDKYIFVRSIRDIEAAHIRGNTTAVIWNTQTSTIINGDLKKIATLKEMGIGSMILTYNDLFRAGAGSLTEFNGNTSGVTSWGLAIIDYYVKLVGVDHVGIASDDMFTTKPTMDFVAKNSAMYADDGYMVSAFNKGATGCGELAKILPAITDELWKRGYSDEDIKKIYGGNKMRVYREVWEGFSPENDPVSKEDRDRFVNEQRQKFLQR